MIHTRPHCAGALVPSNDTVEETRLGEADM